MVDDANITLTSLIIICNYLRDAFGKRAILPEESVQNLGTGYMEAEYRTYWLQSAINFQGFASA